MTRHIAVMLLALAALAACKESKASADTAAAQYSGAGTTQAVGAAVMLQSADGYTAGPVNAAHPLPVVTSTAPGLTMVVSTQAEASHIWKVGAGDLYGFHVTNGAVAGYVMLFDAVTVPADGPVSPVACFSLPASTSTLGGLIQPRPLHFANGLVAVFSTTGCFTKTSSPTAFFAAQVQ